MKISSAKREHRGEVKGCNRVSIKKNIQWKLKELKYEKRVTVFSLPGNTKQAASELPIVRKPRLNEG